MGNGGTVCEATPITPITPISMGSCFRLMLDPRVGLAEMIAGCVGHTCDEVVGHGSFRIAYDPELLQKGVRSLEFEVRICDLADGCDFSVSGVSTLIAKIDPENPWRPVAIQHLLALGRSRSTFLYEKRPLVALGSRRTSPPHAGFCYPMLAHDQGVPHIGSAFRSDGQSIRPLGFPICRLIRSCHLPVA